LALGPTAFLANKINDHLCGVATWTAPSNLYVKLHTGAPGASGTSNAAAETTRKQAVFVTNSASRTIANTSALTWTAMAATETITHVSLWDASSGGNCLHTGALSPTVNVISGGTLPIPVGSLTVNWTIAS
jgi:hypothetical protein